MPSIATIKQGRRRIAVVGPERVIPLLVIPYDYLLMLSQAKIKPRVGKGPEDSPYPLHKCLEITARYHPTLDSMNSHKRGSNTIIRINPYEMK